MSAVTGTEQLPSSPQRLPQKEKKEQLDVALKGSECSNLFVMERKKFGLAALTAQLGNEKIWVLTKNFETLDIFCKAEVDGRKGKIYCHLLKSK